MHSSLLPFEVRARVYWHKYRHTWIARRPDDFIGKLHWKLLKHVGRVSRNDDLQIALSATLCEVSHQATLCTRMQ